VLEFSQVWKPLKPLYDGLLVQGAAAAGQALWLRMRTATATSPSRFAAIPGRKKLKRMMEQAGCARVEYYNLSAGVVALHRGYKI